MDSYNQMEIQSGAFDTGNTSSKINLADIFRDRNYVYLNELTLFLAHFNTIPNFIDEDEIDCEKSNAWFVRNYAGRIKDHHFSKRFFTGNRKAELDDVFYVLFEEFLIDFDISCSTVRFLFRETAMDEVEKVMKEIRRFRKRKGNFEINLIRSTQRGFNTSSLQVSRQKFNLMDHYNDDFQEVHQTILKKLSGKNGKGLVLLHGKPGTGKTTYIRYLVPLIKKKVIFLPPSMASAITNPELIYILTENPNSVFVIEDAEKIIVERNKEERSPVSALLNLSDGLLSDCLNIQVVCTFNTDISMIDSAIMRKGRLIARYEFKELTMEKSRQLSEKLGFSNEICTPMSLAAIYNQGEKDFEVGRKRNTMGFMRS